MKIVDTHTHIYSAEFDADRDETIRRAREAGVAAIMLPNEDYESIDRMNRTCDAAPDFAFPMMGLHPTSVNADYVSELKKIEAQLTKCKYFAIGEIGIDLYWDRQFEKQQKETFKEQLQWSVDLNLPVSIHMRNAFHESLEIMYNVGVERLRGVFHCFGGGLEEWSEIEKLHNFYVGIGGVVTYKNCALTEVLEDIPIDRIVLETDAPYLAPVPYRGRRNEPAYISETLKKVAECKKLSKEYAAERIFMNSSQIFAIPIKVVEN